MVSHESLFGLVRVAGAPQWVARVMADTFNRASVRAYDTILCTTVWASQDFERIGTRNIRRVPLGVDLTTFHPDRYDPVLRASYAKPSQVLLVHCGRLSAEKRPIRSIEALTSLRDEGVDAVLVVAGDGPLRQRLVRRTADLPVAFVNFVADRQSLAALLATADVVLAPGPIGDVRAGARTSRPSPAALRSWSTPRAHCGGGRSCGRGVPGGRFRSRCRRGPFASERRGATVLGPEPSSSAGRPRWPASSTCTAWMGSRATRRSRR
jgi:hypothetical protein